MNILLINHYAGSCKHGMEYRPFYLAREWVRSGHQVTVVAASQSHLRIQQPGFGADCAEETLEGIRYLWLRTPRYAGNGVRRAVNMFAFVAQLARHSRRILAEGRPDVVIASSTYPLDIFPAYRLARSCEAKLVFEVHDLWPLTLIELGGMSPYHPFVLLLQRAENFAYRRADRVVSLLPKAGVHMREHGMAENKFIHIPNGIAATEWAPDRSAIPREHAQILEQLRSRRRFLVGYAGAHGTANALGFLIEAARYLQGDPVSFVLVGQGPEKDRLQTKSRELGLDNVCFLPPVAKPSMPALLAAMDALYIGWSKKPIYRFGVSPNKLLDYMMSGKPVVHAIEAGNDLVAESGCGISCPPEDPAAIVKAVLRLMHCPAEEREAIGLRGRRYVLGKHEYAVLARRFLAAVA